MNQFPDKMETQISSHDLYKLHILPPDSKCIRILQVHATVGAEKNSTTLACDLFVADLDAKPNFAALSYVWSAPGPFKLNCGSVEIPVTENCFSALRHIRDKIGTFAVWVDAVCINQKDNIEKGTQIPLMGDICSSAREVFVWMGETSPVKDRAIAYFQHGGPAKFVEQKTGPDGEYVTATRYFAAWWAYQRSRWSSTYMLAPERRDTKVK